MCRTSILMAYINKIREMECMNTRCRISSNFVPDVSRLSGKSPTFLTFQTVWTMVLIAIQDKE